MSDTPLAWACARRPHEKVVKLCTYVRSSPSKCPVASPKCSMRQAISLNNLASVLAGRNVREAEALYRQALEIRRKTLPPKHPHIAHSLLGLGQLLTARGKPQEAEPMLKEAVEIRRAALPKGHPEIGEAEKAWAECLAKVRSGAARPQ